MTNNKKEREKTDRHPQIFCLTKPSFLSQIMKDFRFLFIYIYYCGHRLGPLKERKKSTSSLACDLPISLLCCFSHKLLKIFFKLPQNS